MNFKILLVSICLFSLLIFASVSLATDGGATYPYETWSLIKDWTWEVWAGVVMGITALLLAIGFMISKVFAVPAWQTWVKQEWANLLFTALIIALFVAFEGVIEVTSQQLASEILTHRIGDQGITTWTYDSTKGRWSQEATPQWTPDSCPSPCHIYIARAFLGSTYEKYLEILLKKEGEHEVSIFGLKISSVPILKGVAPYYGTSLLFESLGVGGGIDLRYAATFFSFRFSYPVFAARAIFNNALATVIDSTLKALGSVKMQEFVLVYFQGLFPVLLVSGMIFRIPWFTRKLGGLLLACGIGLYAIYPLTYVLCWYTFDRTSVDIETKFETPRVMDLGSLYEEFSKTKASTSILFTEYDEDTGAVVRQGLFDIVSRTYIIRYLIPVLAIFITIGFIRHFSPMIGGDAEIAGLTRLI